MFCRFAEPNGVPPRRSTATDFSPNRDMSPLSKKVTTSPRYRKALLHRMSTDSVSSDDGFGDNIALPSVGSLLVSYYVTMGRILGSLSLSPWSNPFCLIALIQVLEYYMILRI